MATAKLLQPIGLCKGQPGTIGKEDHGISAEVISLYIRIELYEWVRLVVLSYATHKQV